MARMDPGMDRGVVEGRGGGWVRSEAVGGRAGGVNWVQWFVWSAGCVLVVTGLAKVWGGLGESAALRVVDPVFGVRYRVLMVGVGLLELGVAWACLVVRRWEMSLGLLSWLGLSIGVYRLGLWWMGWKAPCGCLGHLTDALGVSPVVADRIMVGILVYMVVGSLLGLGWVERMRRQRPVQVVPAEQRAL